MMKGVSTVVLAFVTSALMALISASNSAKFAVLPNLPGDTIKAANAVLRDVTFLMSNIRSKRNPEMLDYATKARLIAPAGYLLSYLVGLEVQLIAERTGQPSDAVIDKLLTRIEEKSYQLKTMLIQVQQNFGATSYYTTAGYQAQKYPTFYNALPSQQGLTNSFG